MARFTKKKSRYCQLFERTMELWKVYGEEYRGILKKYDTLLAKKRELNIKPLDIVAKSALKEFPIINFLYLNKVELAEEYLLRLTERELVELMADIDLYIDSKLRRDLLARITDYTHQIRIKECGRSLYAMDPDACGRGRRASNHTEREYRN